MLSQYTLKHIDTVLNVHTSILQYIFSGCGNKMSPEKIHFCFWHPPSFDFYIVMISPRTNNFSTRLIGKNPIQLASPQTSTYLCNGRRPQ